MAFLTCDEPPANQIFFPGPLTVANGGVSVGFVSAARAKIYPSAATIPANPPDPASDPDCIELEVDSMTGQNWWLSPAKTIPGIREGGNKLVLWGLRDGHWQPPTEVPLIGQGAWGPPWGPGPAPGPGPLPLPPAALMAMPAPAAGPGPAAAPLTWPASFSIRVKRNVLSTGIPQVRELLNAGALQAAPFNVDFDIIATPPGGLVWSSATSTAQPEDPDTQSKWILYVPDTTATFARVFLIQQVHSALSTYSWYTFSLDPAADNLFVPFPAAPQLRHNLLVSPA